MTLHDAITAVMEEARRPLTTSEIAMAVNSSGLYQRGDGQPIPASQISARIRKYPHLFIKVGQALWASSGSPKTSGLAQVAQSRHIPSQASKRSRNLPSEVSRVEAALLAEGNFRAAGTIDDLVPSSRGLYAIRVVHIAELPQPFHDIANQRDDNLVYIGEAKTSLRTRLLNQELRGIGHGTFFRSIGSVLGYRPQPGSLAAKANQRNFVFGASDRAAIIDWINANLTVAWVELRGPIHATEVQLLRNNGPLFNLSGNPSRLPELVALRRESQRIAQNIPR